MANNSIRDKLEELSPVAGVRDCLLALFVFERDHDEGGFQYKKEYRAAIEKFAKSQGSHDLEN